MPPIYSEHNKVDCSVINAEGFGNGPLCFTESVTPSDFNNLFVIKNGYGVFFSTTRVGSVTSLPIHVSNILRPCSKKQMLWVAARWIVAMMAYVQSSIVITIRKNVRQLMSIVHFTKIRHSSVPLIRPATHERPAFVRKSDLYFLEKPVGSGLFEFFHVSLKSRSTKFLKLCRVFLHKSLSLICATLSGVRSPRGHFHCVDLSQSCQPI